VQTFLMVNFKRMTKILLMNPNNNADTTARMCTIAARVLGFAPDPWTAPEGPALISTPDLLDAAAGHVEAAHIPDDTTAIILSAFGDPGFAGLAQQVSCPIVGIGAAAARAAAKAGLPFSVATTTPALSGRIDALMTQHAGPTTYVGCFTTDVDPDALMADMGLLDAELLDAITRAQQAGAVQVIIGGGPLGDAAMRLNKICSVALLNPIECAAREAADLIEARSCRFPLNLHRH
jgi:allantoin racemase